MSIANAASAATPVLELYQSPRWYACRTRARAEKRVNAALSDRAIEAYLPLVTQTRQWSDRKKRVAFPLFPGYAFARFALDGIHRVLSVPGVVTVVQVNGYPTPLRDDELESIKILATAVNDGHGFPESVEPESYPEVGEEVVVRDGAFAGMRGGLLQQRGATRVAVRLSALRQAVSVELPQSLLRLAAG